MWEKWYDALENKLSFEPLSTSKRSPPPAVYHYTTPEGLCGILDSQKVWATDCRFLNDSGESEAGLVHARRLLREKFWRHDDPLRNQLYRDARGYFLEPEEEKNFVFSLSEKRDDLSQWRAYANEGMGFTVGFDTQALISCAKQPEAEFDFQRTCYNLREFDSRIKELLNQLDAGLDQWAKATENRNSILRRSAATFDIVSCSAASMYKHSSFKSENEWRMVSFVPEGDNELEVKIRAKRSMLVPYIELEPKIDSDKLPIIEIGIGPGYRGTSVDYAVRKLCKRAKIAPTIYFADTSFRRLA